MAKVSNLEDLKEKFSDGKEPMKGKRNPKPAWSPITRNHTIIHLFFNILGEYTNLKNKLPSIDAKALEKMKSPIAHEIIKLRQDDKSLKSFQNVEKFILPSEMFGFRNDTKKKASVNFNPISRDNVERAFTIKKRSIPINMDKRARGAFICPEPTISIREIESHNPKNVEYLRQISDADVFPQFIWAGFDFKQAELFVLCAQSGDHVLREALLSKDVHSYVAGLIFEKDPEQVTKEERELSKTIQYKLIYSAFNVDLTQETILRDNPEIDEQVLEDALASYQQQFYTLFEWVHRALFDWFDSEGLVTYFMGARKQIRPRSYLKRDLKKFLGSHEGRLAINTYGQNSVGLLLKIVYSKMFRDRFVFENTLQHIPVFDSMNMLVDVRHLADVIHKVEQYATPEIAHDGFDIRMATDWKLSDKSWGEMKDINVDFQTEFERYEW